MLFSHDSDVTEDLGLFEAAAHARLVELDRPVLNSVVTVLDGSNQDDTARRLALVLAQRAGATVHEQQGAASAADILQLCRDHNAGLLVVPVPFGRDSSELRDESLGSVVDMLLLESTCPVLCVRDVLDDAGVQSALSGAVLSVNAGGDDCMRAAGWGLSLLGSGGQLELLAVADADVLAEAQKLLGEAIDTDALRAEAVVRAVMHELGGLIAAIQKQGLITGLNVHVELQTGRFAKTVLERANPQRRLIVVGAPKDHRSPAFHRAVDLVLGARGPVLVV